MNSQINQIQNNFYFEKPANQEEIKILAIYYLFTKSDNDRNLEEEQSFFKNLCNELGIKGTILISKEGINGTIAGIKENIDHFLYSLKTKLTSYNFSSEEDILEFKFNNSDFIPFSKLKILLKSEVVALQSDIENLDQSLKPINANSATWNDLLNSNNDVQLIDTRNDYEFEIGTFSGAINPGIKNFREFKDYLKAAIEKGELKKEKPCAIFCTGGIRCEKAGIYMRNLGFDEVYQLQGGILKYFEDTKNDQKKWIGDCFVFDDRITVNDQLEPGELRCIHCHSKIQTNEEKKSVTKARVVCKDCSSEQK